MKITNTFIKEIHFEQFKSLSLTDKLIAQNTIQLGVDPKSWFDWIHKKIKVNFDVNILSNEKVSRESIFSMVLNKSISTEICIITILAWGGMNRKNGFHLFSGSLEFINICERIRQGMIDRKQSYAEFLNLRKQGLLKGMGPAYYTKLIFFLMPRSPKGYIMDQWTSRSINLLFDPKIVEVSINKQNQHTVKDTNTSEIYEAFCTCIEKIAAKMNLDFETVEMMMFSTGSNKGKWRNYLKKF